MDDRRDEGGAGSERPPEPPEADPGAPAYVSRETALASLIDAIHQYSAAPTVGLELVSDEERTRWVARADDEVPAGEATRLRPPSPAVRVTERRRQPSLLLAVGALAVVLALGGAAYVAVTNKSRADRWQERTERLERNASALNSVLIARSNALNERTVQLNRLAARVREGQGALRRSQADVSSLARRQRELANEKAQLEDGRVELTAQAATLEDIALDFATCKDGLVELLGYALRQEVDSMSNVVPGVEADCGRAETRLAAYRSIYGG
jgi:hypothetical protein